MKAVTYKKYGPPEVLQVEEVAIPSITEKQMLVRVRAVEATKADCEMRSFKFPVLWFWLPMRLFFGVRRPRRQILGMYFSGEVETVGAAVHHYQPGDAIFGASNMNLGAYAEYMALPDDLAVAVKPKNMTFAEAAAVPLGGFNGLHFMTLAALQPGEKILINGAGGSIGAHAAQLAVHAGAEVSAVDAPHKFEFLKRMGVSQLIDYTADDFTLPQERYDVVFDMVANSRYSTLMRCL